MRVHHFARQLASPFPLLAAIAARTSRIEIGTGVIDMRYENPLYMAEEAAATDLLSDGRLQLGVSRGSPETALRGSEAFGYVPPEGSSDADLARDKTALFLAAIRGQTVVDADPRMTGGVAGRLAIQPQSPGLADRIWWGSGTRATAEWTAQQGMNLMSSTLLVEDTGVPFDELQAEQIARFRAAWAEAGWEREPRVSVSRSVLPIVTDLDRQYFGGERSSEDQVGILEGVRARFGKSYVGEPDAARRGAGQGRRRPRGRHPADHRAQHARRRVQRPAAGDHRPARRAGDRLGAPRPARRLTGPWWRGFHAHRGAARLLQREQPLESAQPRRSKPRSSTGALWVSAPTAR